MSSKAVTKYLQHYAEAETTQLGDFPAGQRYQHVVLIPAYKEPLSFLRHTLEAKWFNRHTLLILVINQPETEPATGPQRNLYTAAEQYGEVHWHAANLKLITPLARNAQAHGHLLLVDRFSAPIPHKQGVGLARKIAADLALALISRGIIQTQWMCSTDADASLPDDYFAALPTLPPRAIAACYDFKHVADADNADQAVTAATQLYEKALRYYVAGLRYAGSPYAHFTIGSILAFKAEAYAQVRGFPKRAAGEDFYLLNKLVKLGPVTQAGATIKLKARLSDRVPFGTGMSSAKIMQLQRDGQAFCYYHPQIFSELRTVLSRFTDLWDSRERIDAWLLTLPEYSRTALVALGISTITSKLNKQCHNQAQFEHQITDWFDGLKTLQFVHRLQRVYPDVPFERVQDSFV